MLFNLVHHGKIVCGSINEQIHFASLNNSISREYCLLDCDSNGNVIKECWIICQIHGTNMTLVYSHRAAAKLQNRIYNAVMLMLLL